MSMGGYGGYGRLLLGVSCHNYNPYLGNEGAKLVHRQSKDKDEMWVEDKRARQEQW